MAIIITFFNHKGGVGKTTLTYNLGWDLAKQGKKTLLIDADPQCNLTEFCFGIDNGKVDLFTPNILDSPNIYDTFLPAIRPLQKIEKKKSEFCNKKQNLDILLGSIDFAELDADIGLAIAQIAALRELPGAVYGKICEISRNYDYILIDLAPSLSSTNQLFLKLSDYFIAPVFPGAFSLQALRNLSKIFRRWNRELSTFDKFKNELPQFLGMVFQNYRPYSRVDEKDTQSAKRFEEDKKILNNEVIRLAKDLNSMGMSIGEEEFKTIFGNKTPYTIAEIPDYNQLKLVSEKNNKPVIALTNDDLKNTDFNLNTPQYRDKRDMFIQECHNIIKGLIKLKPL